MIAAVIAHTVPGVKRGRALGFPTMNLAVDGGTLPANGVYAVRVDDRPGVCHIGSRPTFHDESVTCEVFVLDEVLPEVPANTPVSLQFIEYLRSIQSFSDAAALQIQIRADVAAARKILMV